jgi:uncharacterized protein YggU (UPF0235/DUF167 family)
MLDAAPSLPKVSRMSCAVPYSVDENGVRLAVRLTPRAKNNGLCGLVTDPDGRPELAIRLSARPVDGAANQALIAFIADGLDLPASRIGIRAGGESRQKLLHIAGQSRTIIARLSDWIG